MPRNSRRKTARELRAATGALRAAKRRVNRRPQTKNVQYTRPLRQGVGAITTKPFGAVLRGSPRTWFDATHPHHLPLPRAIGPYSVVRTTALVNTTAQVNLFGPMQTAYVSGGLIEEKVWCTACGAADVAHGTAINGASNTQFFQLDAMRDAAWDGCSLVPAAFSIQVMNPSSVSSAAGIARIGRLRCLPDLQGDTRTWETLANEMTSYNFPRLCSGGKLALRGVKVDAVPFDMSDLADFTLRINLSGPGTRTETWDTANHKTFKGFAPIILLMDNALAVAGGLDVLVTVEWRVRFDPSNPAQGTHVQHPVAPDSVWGSALQEMEAAGNGAIDIAENVAELGAATRIASVAGLLA